MAYVYKRGKTWAVRFSKRTKVWDSKKQQEISKLKQKQKGGFKTKTEARQYGIKMESSSLLGVDVTKNPIFAEYFKNWYLNFKFPAVRESTQKRYITNYNYILNYFGHTKMKDITRSGYQAFLNRLGKTHAPTTVHKTNIMVRACVGNAVDDGILTRDFTKRVTIVGNKDHIRATEYLNTQEMNKLIELCLTNITPRYTSKYLVLAGLYTGARFGELAALKWKDIDFENDIISITKTWDPNLKKLGPPKTPSSVRKIKVNSFLLEILKQLKINKSEFIFAIPRTGLPPSSSAVNQFLRKSLKQLNIDKPDFHFHSLRHTHVSYLITQHIDIFAISKRLGHANVATTLKIYSHLLDEYKDEQDTIILRSLDKFCASNVHHF